MAVTSPELELQNVEGKVCSVDVNSRVERNSPTLLSNKYSYYLLIKFLGVAGESAARPFLGGTRI